MHVIPHPSARTKTCPSCGAGFSCGMDAQTGCCWCDDLPTIMAPDPELSCLCPDCLKATLRAKISDFIAALPPEGRRNSLAVKYARPEAPLVDGLDFYWENGLMVFTEWFHLKRGECCGNGCRHCPYPPKR